MEPGTDPDLEDDVLVRLQDGQTLLKRLLSRRGGHVPADLITRLLKEKPKVLGLAVPGMPIGSPGMEGGTKEAYEVLTFDAAGRTTVFARR